MATNRPGSELANEATTTVIEIQPEIRSHLHFPLVLLLSELEAHAPVRLTVTAKTPTHIVHVGDLEPGETMTFEARRMVGAPEATECVPVEWVRLAEAAGGSPIHDPCDGAGRLL